MASTARQAATVTSPVVIRDTLQISAHICPRALCRELQAVFPGILSSITGMVAIPTVQHAAQDLVRVGESIENEKDELLNRFVVFAQEVVGLIQDRGFWADYIDPCSGLPMNTPSNSIYSEVEGMQRLLSYRSANAGACKVLLHPRWGSQIYPATIFTMAPPEVAADVLRHIVHTDLAGRNEDDEDDDASYDTEQEERAGDGGKAMTPGSGNPAPASLMEA